jgi:hypothetical protein
VTVTREVGTRKVGDELAALHQLVDRARTKGRTAVVLERDEVLAALEDDGRARSSRPCSASKPPTLRRPWRHASWSPSARTS